MRKVTEVKRVPLGMWVRVLKDGAPEPIMGCVVSHHDVNRSKHTLKMLDGSMVTVDLVDDTLLKMGRTPFPVDIAKAAPHLETPRFVEPVRIQPITGWSSAYVILAAATGAVTGSIFTVLVVLNLG